MDAMIVKILLVLGLANTALSILDAALQKAKEVLPTPGVNQAADVVHTIVDFVKKAVDYLSANRAH